MLLIAMANSGKFLKDESIFRMMTLRRASKVSSLMISLKNNGNMNSAAIRCFRSGFLIEKVLNCRIMTFFTSRELLR